MNKIRKEKLQPALQNYKGSQETTMNDYTP